MLKRLQLAFSSFRFRSLFFRILLLLLLLVSIPVLFAGLTGSWYSKTTIREEVEQSSVQMLEQTRRLMDVLLNDMNDWTVRLAQSEAVGTLLAGGEPAHLEPSADEVKSQLLELYINSPYVESVYVYFAGRRQVVSPLRGLTDLAEADDSGWLPYVPQAKKTESPWVVRDGQGAGAPRVSLIRPLPMLGDQVEGAIIINMNQQGLFQSPSLRWMREGEEIWMVSPDGRYAFSNKSGAQVTPEEFALVRSQIGPDTTTFTQSIRGRPHAFSAVVSPYTQWKYIDVIPVDTLYRRSGRLETIMLAIALLAVGGAFLLAFVAAARIYSPIYSLFELSSSRRKDWSRVFQKEMGNELGYLASAMKTMNEHAAELEGRMREHLPVLQQSFLHLLLREKSGDAAERMARFAYYQLKVHPFGFFVLVLRIDDFKAFHERYGPTDQSLFRYFIAKLAVEVVSDFQANAFPVYTEGRDIVVIGNLASPEQIGVFRELAFDASEKISVLARQYLPFSLSIGIGELRENPCEISDSFEEAGEALEIRAFHGPSSVIPIWSARRERRGGMAFLDRMREIRQGVIAHLRAEGHDSADEARCQLRELTGLAEGLPFAVLQHACYQLVADVAQRAADFGLRMDDRWELSRMHEDIMKRETVEQLIGAVAESVQAIKIQLNRNEEPARSPVVQQIIDYVQANYRYDISLGGIAEQLRLDPSHVSRLFRQELQVTFIEYLISVRLEKAKELLVAGGSIPIKEIGTAVGYENPRSFNRMFKKYEGITPGEYRELHAPAKLDLGRVY